MASDDEASQQGDDGKNNGATTDNSSSDAVDRDELRDVVREVVEEFLDELIELDTDGNKKPTDEDDEPTTDRGIQKAAEQITREAMKMLRGVDADRKKPTPKKPQPESAKPPEEPRRRAWREKLWS